MALMKDSSAEEDVSMGSTSTIDFPETKAGEYRFAHAKLQMWKGLNTLSLSNVGEYTPKIDFIHVFLLDTDA
jgi:hypothetical protein